MSERREIWVDGREGGGLGLLFHRPGRAAPALVERVTGGHARVGAPAG